MKTQAPLIIASIMVFLISNGAICGETKVEYSIQIGSDGSASWIIRQSGTDILASLGTLVDFRNRVASLEEAARSKTQRDMATDVVSVNSTLSGSYVIVEYRFDWSNFSRTDSGHMVIGDVFQVGDFFLRLYGDGAVYVKYPVGYSLESVSPRPYERDDSLQTLKWVGTQDFGNGLPTITLVEKPAGSEYILGQDIIIIAILIAAMIGITVGFYMLESRKRRRSQVVASEPSLSTGIEDAEKKIVEVLKSFGGSLNQAAITEHCKFSKAKTSQTLSALESKGVVRRYKKGRDKVVILAEQKKK